MPSVTRARAPSPQPFRHRRSELQHPAADRFIGNIEPTLGKEILHVAVARGEAKIEPDRVLDNRRRKAVAAIGEQGHARMLSYPPFSRSPVSVTMRRSIFTSKKLSSSPNPSAKSRISTSANSLMAR